MGCTLNLQAIHLLNRDEPVKYNPVSFAALIANPTTPQCKTTTALFFDTGNVVHTGSRTEEHARLAAQQTVLFLNEKLGIRASVNNFQITNMVADFKVGFEIDLHSVDKQLGANSKYHPKDFPACRMTSVRSKNRKALLYFSGGIVLMGLKSRLDISQLQREVWNVVVANKLKPKGSVSKREYRLIKENNNVDAQNIDSINQSIKQMKTMTQPLKKELKKTLIRESKNTKVLAEKAFSRSLNPLNPILLTDRRSKTFLPNLSVQ